MEPYQFDVATAFLTAEIRELLFMDQPPGYPDNTSEVCKLTRGVYETRQAPRQFDKKNKSVFLGLSLKQAFSEPGVHPRTQNLFSEGAKFFFRR